MMSQSFLISRSVAHRAKASFQMQINLKKVVYFSISYTLLV